MSSWQVRDGMFAPIALTLLIVTALFTPWWGTVVVVALLRLFVGLSQRLAVVLTFAAWLTACFIRDAQGDFGPSRLLAKLFSLGSMHFAVDSLASRAIVYTMISLIGLMLAFLTVGVVKSLQVFVNSLRADTSKG